MEDSLVLKNNIKKKRMEQGLSQSQLAEMVGVSRNTISSIETGQFSPTAKLALILCIGAMAVILRYDEKKVMSVIESDHE